MDFLDFTPGSVRYKGITRFCVRIARCEAVLSARVRLKKDGEGEEAYPLFFSALIEGRDEFSAGVRITSPGLYFYRFDFDGKITQEFKLTVFEEVYPEPKDFYGTVMYQIFPDRFAIGGRRLPAGEGKTDREWGDIPEYLPVDGEVKNNDFFGGNLAGIEEKIPYLKALSVDVLYLNPIFAAYSNHKYDTADYLKIDPSFGTEADFVRLAAVARSAGIRIILDGVFSHTGADSVYFDKYGNYGGRGAYCSKESGYYSWYTFQEYPDKYSAWWNFATLPEVRKDDPSYVEFITGGKGVLAYWLKRGASGFRLDVADELPDGFLEKLTSRVKATDPRALIVGEVWENAADKIAYGVRKKYLLGRELDTVMNYPFRTALIEYAVKGNAENFRRVTEAIVRDYPERALRTLMNSLGTHDTARILNVLSGAAAPVKRTKESIEPLDGAARKKGISRMRFAYALLYFLPGNPCIYYGDEVGLEGWDDPQNRRCYPWGGEDTALLEYFTALGRVRRNLRKRLSGTVFHYAQKGVAVFDRGEIRIAANASGKTFEIDTDGEFKLLFSEKAELAGGILSVRPLGIAVLSPNKNKKPH